MDLLLSGQLQTRSTGMPSKNEVVAVDYQYYALHTLYLPAYCANTASCQRFFLQEPKVSEADDFQNLAAIVWNEWADTSRF